MKKKMVYGVGFLLLIAAGVNFGISLSEKQNDRDLIMANVEALTEEEAPVFAYGTWSEYNRVLFDEGLSYWCASCVKEFECDFIGPEQNYCTRQSHALKRCYTTKSLAEAYFDTLNCDSL